VFTILSKASHVGGQFRNNPANKAQNKIFVKNFPNIWKEVLNSDWIFSILKVRVNLALHLCLRTGHPNAEGVGTSYQCSDKIVRV
jgi:hypothetical protein